MTDLYQHVQTCISAATSDVAADKARRRDIKLIESKFTGMDPATKARANKTIAAINSGKRRYCGSLFEPISEKGNSNG